MTAAAGELEHETKTKAIRRSAGRAVAVSLASWTLSLGCALADTKPPAVPIEQANSPPSAARTDASEVDEITQWLGGDEELAKLTTDLQRRVQILIAIPSTVGESSLRRVGFRVDAEYFYPASAVKLCAAYAAIEKLDDLRHGSSPRIDALGLSTPLRMTKPTRGKTHVVYETTLRAELEKSLVLSDNDAHNRLVQFVGRDELAWRMSQLGLPSARVSQPMGDAAARSRGALASSLRMELGARNHRRMVVPHRTGFELPLKPAPPPQLGTAHVDASGHLVPGPMDFSDKNAILLRELQDLLIAVVRPDLYDRATLRALPDGEELVSLLGMLPSELLSVPSVLDGDHKPFHLAVVDTVHGESDRVRVIGKGGHAYGFFVENAYVLDRSTNRSFFVAATIYVNDNDVLNDDHYEYDSIGRLFMTRLGERLTRALLLDEAQR